MVGSLGGGAHEDIKLELEAQMLEHQAVGPSAVFGLATLSVKSLSFQLLVFECSLLLGW